MDPYKDTPAGPAAAKALERIKTCFGKSGDKTMPCDNNCGTQNIFQDPELIEL